MGVVLYREGNTHTVRGLRVEARVFDDQLFEPNLGAGWFLSPEDVYAEPEEVIEAPEDEEQAEYKEEVEETIEEPEEAPELPTKEKIDTNGSGKLSNKEIRAAAKSIGIDDYDSARIATLKEKLSI